MDPLITATQTLTRKKTSVEIRPELWDELRVRAIRLKLTAWEALEEAVQSYLPVADARIAELQGETKPAA